LACAAAHAQGWRPEKPVELIAASGPGGNTDKLARTIQSIMQGEKLVTVPINVVNRTGGNQTIARTYLNQHPGDGHYLDVGNPTLITNHLMGLTPQQPSDFSLVALLLDEYTVLSVRADSPFKTGAELLRRLVQQPDSVSIGLTTRGGANHMAFALAAKAAGADLKRLKIVSFKSNGESMTALLGGHIDAVASSASPAIPHLAQGSTRAIAISAPKRMGGALAQVPTWKEQQVNTENSNWRLLVGPRGLQPPQMAFWEDAAARLSRSETWKKELEANAWEHHFLRGQPLRDFIAAEIKESREVMTEIGLAK
jgi:putative tricarboxylic transport membrane protein